MHFHWSAPAILQYIPTSLRLSTQHYSRWGGRGQRAQQFSRCLKGLLVLLWWVQFPILAERLETKRDSSPTTSLAELQKTGSQSSNWRAGARKVSPP
jgi:hypothetical protein